MREQDHVGFDGECRELRIEVLRRPWRLRFVRPVSEALAEVADLAQDVQRDRAHADELRAQLRRRLDAGEPLEPEPTDFKDLLVRTRRGRPRGASRHTEGRPGR